MKKNVFLLALIASIAMVAGCTSEKEKVRQKRFEARPIVNQVTYHMETCATALDKASSEGDALKACSDFEKASIDLKAQIDSFKAKNPLFDLSNKNGDLAQAFTAHDETVKHFKTATTKAAAKFSGASAKIKSLKLLFE